MTSWYRIENAKQRRSQMFIYDEIGSFGITADAFLNDLRETESEEIELHLNTPGGNVFQGIAIYNALRNAPARVEVVVDSLAASIGSVIAMAGDKISMAEGSQMMIHEARAMEAGTAADLRKMADTLDRQSTNIASIYASRAGQEVSFWRDLMLAETWMFADEAVEFGLADEILQVKAPTAEFDLSIYNYAGRRSAPSPRTPDTAVVDPEAVAAILKEVLL